MNETLRPLIAGNWKMNGLRGDGVAVLPEYFVTPDLKANRLTRIFPRVRPLSDYFRLVFRADDPRRSVYKRISLEMLKEPLR